MVTHIVFWNLKDAAAAADTTAQMKEKLEGLVGVVPGLLSAEVHRAFAGWDVALITTLASREALAVYQNHPAHMAVKQYVHTVTSERTFCDLD